MTDLSKKLISRKLKYPERFRDWQHIAGFDERQVIATVGRVDTVRYQIKVNDAGLNGIRLLFFADLHCGIHSSKLMHNDLIKSINQAEADFIICGGDMLERSFDRRQAQHILNSCQAKSGKIATIGNWECYATSKMDFEQWREFYLECDFSLLCNQSITCQNICFYGIDDIKTGCPEFLLNKIDKYTVLLSHNPDTVIHIANDANLDKFDLALCGHTHAGQVRLPVFGALASSSRYGRKFDCGHFSHRRFAGKNMLISAGIGTSVFPWRLNCPPEIMVIDLVNHNQVGRT